LKFKTKSNLRLSTDDCRLTTSDCRLTTADCRLTTADCRLTTANCRLKSLLDEKVDLFNNGKFIENDPISIPHSFSKKEDKEISGLLVSLIAWGNRKSIISSGKRMVEIMDGVPFEFATNFSERDIKVAGKFVHRTCNMFDFEFFLYSLKNIYLNHGGLERVFTLGYSGNSDVKNAIIYFRNVFLELPYLPRTSRHISNPEAGSAAKRINMFLRWMVRNDNKGVDFGIWNQIPASALYCPLDVHSGNVSRELGILKRKQNDWKAVEELTSKLRQFDPIDPVKYDFALFGIGVNL
jgi:uncharacterized protein (TIGR02757 family)